jgi:protein tyrosine kinase modulator
MISSDITSQKIEWGIGPLIAFLKRRWLLLLVPTTLAALTGYIQTITKEKVFQATVTYLVKDTKMDSPLVDWYSLRFDIDTQLNTLKRISNGPEMMQRLAIASDGDSLSSDELEDLGATVHVSVKADGLVELSVEHADPEEALKRTRALGDIFTEELNRPRVITAQKLESFLKSELSRARANLDDAHLALNTYHMQHAQILPELEAMTYNLLLSMEAEQVELDARRHGLEEKRILLEKDPLVRGQSVSGLKAQIGRTEAEVLAAEERMTERHPKLQQLRAKLDRLRLDLEIREAGRPLPGDHENANPAIEAYRMLLIEIGALDKRRLMMDQRVTELQLKIASAGSHDATSVRLRRDVESHTEIYLDLVRRFERAKTSHHLVSVHHTDLARIIRPASLPGQPIRPRPLFDSILGLIAGLILGCTVAILAELGDRRIHTASDLADALGAQTLLDAVDGPIQ